MKLKKMTALLLVSIFIVTLFAGCKVESTNQDNSGESQQLDATDKSSVTEDLNKKYVVGVDLFYRSDEYYLDIESSLRKRAEKLGVDLVIQNADTDLATQVQHVEDFVTKGVDAILIAPTDPIGAYACVEIANAAGIPIFEFDGTTEDTTGVAAHTTGDFVAEGEKAGEWVRNHINKMYDGRATYAILDYFPSAIVCGGRTAGFIGVMDQMQNVTQVAHQDGGATREGGMTVMEDILTGTNNAVDIVFAINYESGAGAASAIEAAGAGTEVICVSWNAEGFERLENDDPYMKAYLLAAIPTDISSILDVIIDYLDGKEIEKEVFMDSLVVDATNISQLEWRGIVDSRDN